MFNSLTAFTIVMREGIEALLLLILFNRSAATFIQKRYIITGSLMGLAVPMACTAFAYSWVETNTELLSAVGNLAAGLTLAYVFFWSRKIMQHVKAHVDDMINLEGIAVMASSWFIVAREACEVIVMLMGSYSANSMDTIKGIVAAVFSLVIISTLFDDVLKRINVGRFFQATSWIFGLMSIYYLVEGIESLVDLLQ
jgi:FTR1 family protein